MDLIQKKNLCITDPKGDNFEFDYSSLEELNIKLDKSNFSLNNASNDTNMSIENATAKNMQSKESRKRKHPNLRSESYTKTKKFRFTDGVQYYSMSREDLASDESWNKFIKFKIYKNRQIGAIRRQKWRQQNKIGNLKDLIIELKKINDVAASEYLKGLPEHVKQLIRRMKDRKVTKAYPPQLKTFARTLHFHSPAAYKMVRKSFLKCLPCVETLNSWCCLKNCKPGISEEIISHVSTMVKSEKDKGKTCVFNLTFDEMNIKKWAYYCKNSNEWKGYVDLGGQLQDVDSNGEQQKATKALVFMLVNINGGFKTPVAYYLNNGLTGQEKSILINDLLTKLVSKGINAISTTFDCDDKKS